MCRNYELYRQLEAEPGLWPPPHQILEVACALLHRRTEAVGYEVAQESDHVEQGTLACGVWADQYVEAVEVDIHIVEAPVVQGLDATDH